MCGGGLLGGWRASPMAAAHAIAQASPACEPARCRRLGRERAVRERPPTAVDLVEAAVLGSCARLGIGSGMGSGFGLG